MSTELLILVGIIIGLVAGIVIDIFIEKKGFFGLKNKKKGPIGTLRIIEYENEEPYFFLDLDEPIESFSKEKTVTLYIGHRKVSHK